MTGCHRAAEANIIGDPAAADFVFGQPVPMRLIPLDVSNRCRLTAAQLTAMKGKGRFGTFLWQITEFYLAFHRCARPYAAISDTALHGA